MLGNWWGKVFIVYLIYSLTKVMRKPLMWIRIRIHLGPWIRIQRYKITDKMKGKAEFNQQKSYFFFAGNYIFQV